MADELVIAKFNGVVSKVEKQNNGQWKLTVTRDGGGSAVFVLDEVYVISCQAFSIGDSLGLKKSEAFSVGPYRLLGNPTDKRVSVVEIPLGKFLRFTAEGAVEVDLVIYRVGFVVGTVGAPQEGHTSFIVRDDDGEPIDLATKRLSFYREREFQYTPRDYTLDPVEVGKIDIVVSFCDKEEVTMDIYPELLYAMVNGVAPLFPDAQEFIDAVLIAEGEPLMINDEEYFKL